MPPAPLYITTPIYYVTDVPHIGHAYTTIVTDALARFARLQGRRVGFLTGTDEHGQKVARMAEERGVSPADFARSVSDAYRAAWTALEISNDEFIRTTDPDHEAAVTELWRAMEQKGDIYVGDYEGYYCVACEQFYTEKELLSLDGTAGRGACPVHKRPVDKVKESTYYFRLSKYQQPLLDWYDAHPEFVQPEMRLNEVRAFVKGGLEDLSISRTTFTWGIPVPGRAGHVIYVWIDALTNYYSATRRKALEGLWSEGTRIVHMIGKEISRFHAVYWPAMLMSAGLPLPTTIFAHGWWTVNGEKMSKTLGNVVNPLELASDLGVDAIRYFVMREVPLGADGDFSHEALLGRYNAELANDLGNLLNRTIGMVNKYFAADRSVPERPGDADPFDVAATVAKVTAHMEAIAPSKALEEIWALVRKGNAYIDAEAPWKPDADRGRILRNVLELCRCIAHLVSPFMPERATEMLRQLGIAGEAERFALPVWDGRRGYAPAMGAPLFPRVDDDRKRALLDKWLAGRKRAEAAASVVDAPAGAPSDEGLIDVEAFKKMDIRAAKIVAAEPVPKAKKLLKLTVDAGEGRHRQIVAGIAEAYQPAELVGRTVLILANLKPATIRGVTSEGMVLAAGDEAIVGLSGVDRDVAPGTKIR
jgi:methionyl-tRNA synthetase